MTIPARVLLPMVSRSSHRTIGLFSTTAGVAIVVAPATTGLCTDRVGLDGFTVGGGASVTLVGIVLGLVSDITTLAAASWREGTIEAAAADEATDPVTMLPKYGFCKTYKF